MLRCEPMKRFFFLILPFFLCPASLVFAMTHLDEPELLRQADLVAVGDTVSVEQGVDTSHAQARLMQVLKGPEKAGSLVTIEIASGKVMIDESQPNFTAYQPNLLFLQKTPAGYVCLNGADGQKIIRGKNIYPYHDNAAFSLPLETYLKALEAVAKEQIVTPKQG